MRFVPALIILTLGCVIHSADATAADPPVSDVAAPIEEIAEPTEEAVRLDWRVAKGRSKRLEAGAPHGVWIWHDGRNWHLVRVDFTTNGHADGFDFRVRGDGCIRFAIRVDDEESGAFVKLGEKATQPQSWHFRLCAGD